MGGLSMSNSNYPHGYNEPEQTYFPMPEANEEEDARLNLYNEYATIEQSFETFCDQMFETLGENWVYKLSRRTK